MKYLLSVLTIIVIAQYSLAANDPKAFYRTSKILVEKVKPMVNAVLKNLPSKPQFSKYRNELETFAKKLEEKKSKKIPCFYKTFAILNDFAELMSHYERQNTAAEAKEVYALIHKHGLKDLNKEFTKIASSYELDKLGKDLEKLTKSNDPVLAENC